MSEFDKNQLEVIGWAYAYACALMDDGIDIRETTVPAMHYAAKKDLLNEPTQSARGGDQ